MSVTEKKILEKNQRISFTSFLFFHIAERWGSLPQLFYWHCLAAAAVISVNNGIKRKPHIHRSLFVLCFFWRSLKRIFLWQPIGCFVLAIATAAVTTIANHFSIVDVVIDFISHLNEMRVCMCVFYWRPGWNSAKCQIPIRSNTLSSIDYWILF